MGNRCEKEQGGSYSAGPLFLAPNDAERSGPSLSLAEDIALPYSWDQNAPSNFGCGFPQRQTALERFMFNNVNTNFSASEEVPVSRTWYKWGRDWVDLAVPYADFLRGMGVFDDVSWCCSSVYAAYCDNCGNWVYRGIYCDKKRFCPICGNKYAWEKTQKVMKFFEDVAKKLSSLYIINVVFTLPQSLWQLEPGRVFAGLSRVLRKTFERYFRGVEVGGFAEFHSWHSGNPLLGFYPHAHCFVVNYGLDRKTGEFKRLNSRISEHEIKKIYLEELKKEFGNILEGVNRINLFLRFYSFNKNYAELEHAVYYAFRQPQHDVVKFFVETGRDWELEPSEEAWLWELLTLKITRTRWFGFLSCGRRGAFKWRIKKLEREWDKCPYCGAVLDNWRRVSCEELEDLLVDRPPPLK